MGFVDGPVDASGSGGLFPQHPRVGEWESLEGRMLAPHIAAPMESSAKGTERHQTDNVNQLWNSTVIVNTGMTRGGGTMAK
jgi:hypothetical protein